MIELNDPDVYPTGIHGETAGKLYSFISDVVHFPYSCSECLYEAWERMTFGGFNAVGDTGGRRVLSRAVTILRVEPPLFTLGGRSLSRYPWTIHVSVSDSQP